MNADNLAKITGTEEIDGLVKLIIGKVSGAHVYINSFSGLPYSQGKISPEGYFRLEKDFIVTNQRMPKGFLDEKPCCNPGGKILYVVKGEYSDADMNGKPIREYTKGSTVFYRTGSTHRQLSRFGAEVLNISFNGTILGKNPEDCAVMIKMVLNAYMTTYYHYLKPIMPMPEMSNLHKAWKKR